MNPKEAEWLLEEWARWQLGSAVDVGYPRATPFGRMIVPDPSPARLPVDPDRALKTDRVIAKLPQRYRFIIRMHYLDRAPIDAKARRLRLGRKGYLMLIRGVAQVVAMRLDRTSESAYMGHDARGA